MKKASRKAKPHPERLELCRKIAVEYVHGSKDKAAYLLTEFEALIRIECANIAANYVLGRERGVPRRKGKP